jgi:hypothetical protein
MRKILSLMILVLMIGYTYAQKANKPFLSADVENAVQHFTKAEAQNELRTYGDVYWSEDFGGGVIPASWSLFENTGLGYNFIWSDSPVPGPNGLYVTNTDPFASTTVNNGYLCLPSDEYNVPNVGSFIDMDAYAALPMLNLDTTTSVLMVFEQYFRYCCGTATITVEVSNDGTNWTPFDVSKGVAGNNASENPDVVAVNISSVAAGESTVYIRFHYKDVSHYYWAIDDIVLMEGAANDLRIDETYVTSITDFGAQGIGFNGYYAKLPLSQITPMFFQADVFNNGYDDQTNVILTTPVSDLTGVIFTGDDTLAVIATDSTESMVSDWFSTTSIGTYEVEFDVQQAEAEQEPDNNVFGPVDWEITTNDIMVRDKIYSRRLSVGNFTGGSDGDLLGADYTFSANAEVQSLSVFIDYTSLVGSIIIGQLYSYDAGSAVLKIESEEHVVSAADLGRWIQLDFVTIDPTDDDVVADATYMAAVEFYWGGGTDYLYIGVDSDGPHLYNITSSLRIGQDWYWVNYIPMIRLNLDGATVPPVWTSPTDMIICANYGSYSFDIAAMDPNGLALTLDTILSPSFVTAFDDNGNGTATYTVNATGLTVDDTYRFRYEADNGVETSETNYRATIKDDLTNCPLDGQESILKDVINVYPNPASSVINVDNAEGATIQILNMIGEVVKTIDSANALQRVDVSELQAGTYVVSVRSADKVFNQKISLVR